MTTTVTTGTDVIRAALRANEMNLAARGRGMGIAGNRLDAFLQGGELMADELKALAFDLFGGHTLFDPERNVLTSSNTAKPTPLGNRPPPIDPATLPKYDREPRLYPRPLKPEPKRKRPGWAE